MSAYEIYSADPPSFLDRLPDSQRGGFKSRCLCQIRVGILDPDEIAAEVRSVLARRGDTAAIAMVQAIDTFPDEYRAFILGCLNHDAEPEHVRRERRRRGRLEGIRRWLQERGR